MPDLGLIFALIATLGIAAQWIAWRLGLPAIVLMLAAGLLAGPGTGLLDPAVHVADLLRPKVGAAVALILFEGGLTLNLRELRDLRPAGPAVRRLAMVGAPLAWFGAAAAGHYAVGLPWAVAAVFGGVLIVTGPTVVMPMLRTARMEPRPASVLRWEAIVNDPLGALAAVLSFEVAMALTAEGTVAETVLHVGLGIAVAAAIGFAAGRALIKAFRRGWAPEYLKAPAMVAAVLAVWAVCGAVLHEFGLLAVTVMGMAMANAFLPR